MQRGRPSARDLDQMGGFSSLVIETQFQYFYDLLLIAFQWPASVDLYQVRICDWDYLDLLDLHAEAVR